MNIKFLLILTILVLITLSSFCSEKESTSIIKPVGKITYKSLFKVTDESNNEFNLYQSYFSGEFNPSFLFTFTRNDKNIIGFIQYFKLTSYFLSFLAGGIASSVGSITFIVLTPVFYILFNTLFTTILYSVFAGVFGVMAIVFFALSGVFYVKAKKELMQMVDDYNSNKNATSMIENKKKNLNVLSFSFDI
jgi:hypothetical protein